MKTELIAGIRVAVPARFDFLMNNIFQNCLRGRIWQHLPKGCVNTAFVAALLWLCGCASLIRSESMDVSVVNLEFAQATVLETTAVFTVRLQNETPEPLVLEGGVHKFYIDGAFIGKGMSNERIEVPRLGSVTQPITVYLRNLSMGRRIKSIIEAQKVDYRLDSLLYAQGKLGSRLHVVHEGKLDLNEFRPTPRGGN